MNWTIFILSFLGFLVLPATAADTRLDDPVPHIRKADKASELMGIDVRDPQQERLGELKELMFDIKSQRIVYVVLGTGGVLGVGDKLLALPPTVLRPDPDNDCLILNANKDTLERAEGFDANNWPSMASTEFSEENLFASRPGDEIREAAGAERKPETSAVEGAEPPQKPGIGATMNYVKSSELIGLAVNSSEKENLGKISDVAVDLKAGKIRYVVLSSGGFLGVGEKLFAVPMDAFKWAGEGTGLVLNASKDTFKVAKTFDRSQWPAEPDAAFSRPALQFQAEIVEPAGARRDDDGFRLPGSAVQSSAELTATDQSNDRDDLAVTQNLRKAIVGDDSFSFAAKNITIVTTEREVAIRGTVDSVEEAQRIYQKAREVAGERRITDRLSVKNK